MDVEAEDIELGNTQDDNLAFDVDDDLADEDPEALDSDDERAVDEELGIDADETESNFSASRRAFIMSDVRCSADACGATLFAITQRETDACVRGTSAWDSSRCRINECR